MKKLIILAALSTVTLMANAQGVADLAANVQCEAQDNVLKPLLKSTEHPKRGLKPETWLKLAEAYANHTTSCGRDSTSAIKAWEAIQKAKQLNTDGSEDKNIETQIHSDLMYSAVMNQGVAHYNADNLPMAEKLLSMGSQIRPTDTLATYYSGIISNQLEHFDLAEAAFKQYIEVAKGKEAPAYFTLSQLLRKKNDLDGAIDWLKKGIERTGNKDLRAELVNIYIQEKRIDEAISDLKNLIAQDTKNVGAMLNLGLLYDHQDDKQKAMETYQKVLELDPNNFDCLYSVAVIHFNSAVKIKNEVDAMDIKTYNEKGKEIEQKACEEFTKAKPYFDKCVQIKPDDVDVKNSLESLGNILVQCNK